jgi:hypothetical protein
MPIQQQQTIINATASPASVILGVKRAIVPEKRELDLSSLRQSKQFNDFSLATAEYQVANISKLSEQEKMAFLSNLYNTMVIHGIFYGM